MESVQVYEYGSAGPVKMMASECLYQWELSQPLRNEAAPNEVFYCPSARDLHIEDVLHPCKVMLAAAPACTDVAITCRM